MHRALDRLLLACGLAALGLAACRSTPEAGSVGQAGLVVIHSDGSQQSTCLTFPGESITGLELLAASGWDYQVDAANPMGVLVCKIDDEGCAFPEDSCLCECRGVGVCQYWAYFNRDPGGEWVYGFLGASGRQVKDGAVDAWVWLTSANAGDAAAPVLGDLAFEDICARP